MFLVHDISDDVHTRVMRRLVLDAGRRIQSAEDRWRSSYPNESFEAISECGEYLGRVGLIPATVGALADVCVKALTASATPGRVSRRYGAMAIAGSAALRQVAHRDITIYEIPHEDLIAIRAIAFEWRRLNVMSRELPDHIKWDNDILSLLRPGRVRSEAYPSTA